VAIRSYLDRRPDRPNHREDQDLARLVCRRNATAVALTGCQRDLQHRLEVGTRRRQPLVERPTVLEVDSARAMMARFDAIEQPAADSLAARRINAADQPATGQQRPAIRLEAALAAWEIQAHRTLAQPPGPGRSGSGRPRAGAHRHGNRRRRRSCCAARRDRCWRGRGTHPGIGECSAGAQPLGAPLVGAHHGGEPH
jgi:hypothetical protein